MTTARTADGATIVDASDASRGNEAEAVIQMSVKKTLLRRREDMEHLVQRTPNRGLDSSFRCCAAGQRLVQKERCLFTDASSTRLRAAGR